MLISSIRTLKGLSVNRFMQGHNPYRMSFTLAACSAAPTSVLGKTSHQITGQRSPVSLILHLGPLKI